MQSVGEVRQKSFAPANVIRLSGISVWLPVPLVATSTSWLGAVSISRTTNGTVMAVSSLVVTAPATGVVVAVHSAAGGGGGVPTTFSQNTGGSFTAPTVSTKLVDRFAGGTASSRTVTVMVAAPDKSSIG